VNGLDVCERFLTFIDVSSSQKAIERGGSRGRGVQEVS